MEKRRLILLHLSDSHGGHKLGLLNPATILEDEDEFGNLYPYYPKLTATQKWLWHDVYIPGIEQTIELAAGDEIVVIHTGDPTWGDKHPNQLVSTRGSDQIIIATDNMRPLLEMPNVVNIRLAYSTAAHVFGEGTSDQLITQLVRREFPNLNIRVYMHGLADFDGMSVDYAHHGPGTGSRNWLKGNVARYYLRSLMMDDIFEGNQPPKLVLRGHYHDPIIETVRIWYRQGFVTSHLVVAPPLCGLSYWTYKRIKSPYIVRAGIMAYEFIGDKLVDFHPFIRTVDQRSKEEL